jgi:exodeoxyribonuclease V alpha subunit
MGRGAACKSPAGTLTRGATRTGHTSNGISSNLSKAFQQGATEFKATVAFVMFPKKGQEPNEDGFTIAKCTHEITGEQIVMKGKYGPVGEGQLVHVTKGAWRNDARYGEFFQVWAAIADDPVTRGAVLAYLQSMPGVGPILAEAIVDQLGDDCLEKIDSDHQVLSTIKTNVGGYHLSQEDLDDLAVKWEENRAQRHNLLYLASLGVGDATSRKIVKHFGTNTAETIKKDPYLMTMVPDVNFKIVDRIAEKMGIDALDPRRINAGVQYLLEEMEGDGHICLTREEMTQQAPELLTRAGKTPDETQVMEAVDRMIEDGRLWTETDPTDGQERIYTTELWVIETRLLGQIERLLSADPIKPPETLQRQKDSFVTDEQWEAVERAFSYKISILTGSAGCGKTTALKEVLDQLDAHRMDYCLMSPTGKAAKRMTESTGRSASTIHKRLGFEGLMPPRIMQPSDVDLDAEDTSELDDSISPKALFTEKLVVIDEASMLDMRLAERVLAHLTPNTHIMLVGDPNQLPPVGVGSVLLDLIESNRVPITKLNRIFRQAEDSLLVVNANRVKDGLEPYWTKEEAETALGHPVKADWSFVEVENAQQALSATLKTSQRIVKDMGLHPDEVMITAPSRKSQVGVNVLNNMIGKFRNPNGTQIRDGELPLKVGDRVMNIKNRYGNPQTGAIDVMNGDIGQIEHHDPVRSITTIKFDAGTASFQGSDQHEALIPAYASTVHKLQGSEAPAIICPALSSTGGSRMISRALLYTAWTRGKEKCVVISDKETIRDGVQKDGKLRNTTLDLRVGRIQTRIRERWEKTERVVRRRGGMMFNSSADSHS